MVKRVAYLNAKDALSIRGGINGGIPPPKSRHTFGHMQKYIDYKYLILYVIFI